MEQNKSRLALSLKGENVSDREQQLPFLKCTCIHLRLGCITLNEKSVFLVVFVCLFASQTACICFCGFMVHLFAEVYCKNIILLFLL